jgi:DNA polymerase III delta subunit
MADAISPPPVVALVGPDSFLQLESLSRLLSTMPGDTIRVDADGERAELADVLDELRSFAMFGGGKVVVLRSADAFVTKFRSQLEDYLGKPSNSATLVLRLSSLPSNQRIFKLITKVGTVEKCEPPKGSALPRWIVDRARAVHKLKIAPDAAGMLSELVGEDLGRIDSELSKLALQVEPNAVATVNDVTAGVAFQREQEMYDMTNELAAGHPDRAMKRWRQLVQLDSSAEFRAVTWLGMWLENVRKALSMRRQGMAPPAIAQALRIWPRERQQSFFETANALGETGVARAIDMLARVDKDSKSGVGDAAGNVERFLLSLVTRR